MHYFNIQLQKEVIRNGGIHMVFKSKVDSWMAIIFLFIPIVMIYAVITEPDAVMILITALMILLLVVCLTLHFLQSRHLLLSIVELLHVIQILWP